MKNDSSERSMGFYMTDPHDTPKGLWNELQLSILRTSIGRIALAVVLAQAVLGFIRTFVWYLFMPIVAEFLHHQSESVLFEKYRDSPLRWDYLFNSLLQLVLAVVFVLFVNRWIRPKPATLSAEDELTEEHTSDEPSACGDLRAGGEPGLQGTAP